MADYELLDETQLRHLCTRLGLHNAGNGSVLRHRIRLYYKQQLAEEGGVEGMAHPAPCQPERPPHYDYHQAQELEESAAASRTRSSPPASQISGRGGYSGPSSVVSGGSLAPLQGKGPEDLWMPQLSRQEVAAQGCQGGEYGSRPRDDASASDSAPIPAGSATPPPAFIPDGAERASPPQVGITVVGACNYDLITYLNKMPKMGETIHGHKFQMGCGGKGANQAVMAAKLGSQVRMVSKLGEDAFGDVTRENFGKWGVDIEHLYSTDQASSGVAPISVDADGNNSIVIVAGANDLLTEGEVEAARGAIRSSTILITGLEVPVETALAALRVGREEGVTTIFNPAPALEGLPDELFELTDIMCPNQTELSILTGRPVREGASEAELRDVCLSLMEKGVREVVVTLGAEGVFYMCGPEDEGLIIPGTPAKEVVDTSGAGDCFLGSLAHCMDAGMGIHDCIEVANQVASDSVTKGGTQTSFPTRAELGFMN